LRAVVLENDGCRFWPCSCSNEKNGVNFLGDDGDRGGDGAATGESGGDDDGPKWTVSPLIQNVIDSVESLRGRVDCLGGGGVATSFRELNVVPGGYN